MLAIKYDDGQGPEALRLGEVADPSPLVDEVLIEVAAAGINRADLLQTKGHYPPPKGASPILGLECSGRVAALGEGVTGFAVGDEVCALLSGGGYAEKVAVPAGQVMPLPAGVDLVEAAALPEVACTVWSNLVMTGGLGQGRLSPTADSSGEALGPPRILIHGGAGGIGSHAIALCRELGSRVAATAGTPAKLDRCRELGAEVAIDYRNEDFVERVRHWTDGDARGTGVDLVLDVMGAAYLQRNVDALADDGRVIILGLQGGVKGDIDLRGLLPKRGGIIATNLRGRPATGVASKAEICAEVVREVWPLVERKAIEPGVTKVFPLAEAGQALSLLASGESSGKIVLAT